MDKTLRMRVGVQKSGRLTDNSLDLLHRCGLVYSRAPDQLICYGENMPLDILLVRDDDIPGLVIEGACQLGIAGLNVVEEHRLERLSRGEPGGLEVLRNLGVGQCRLCIAAPEGVAYEGPASLEGKKVATSYPFLLRDYLRRNNVEAQVVVLSGAVEIAPKLGKADFICDLVSTGVTLAANHLREVETILESQSVLLRTTMEVPVVSEEWIQRLIRRLDGVLQVRESKYIMLHAPRAAMKEISDLLPGSEAPTVMPLEGRPDKVAVHAVCPEEVFWETLEALQSAGATSLLVLPLEKMLP
ncbi:MAG: ATP phosphoribosyltransferase [Chromatiales bacterium]|nr:ATP phosphoribosyltransferase [Chromatiales bacterium]